LFWAFRGKMGMADERRKSKDERRILQAVDCRLIAVDNSVAVATAALKEITDAQLKRLEQIPSPFTAWYSKMPENKAFR
jgi:hypothetical protein